MASLVVISAAWCLVGGGHGAAGAGNKGSDVVLGGDEGGAAAVTALPQPSSGFRCSGSCSHLQLPSIETKILVTPHSPAGEITSGQQFGHQCKTMFYNNIQRGPCLKHLSTSTFTLRILFKAIKLGE